MNIVNMVRARLNEKNFEIYDDKEVTSCLINHNIEVWSNNNRLMVLKEYTSFHHLLTWSEDQANISVLYNGLQRRYKNNLYFLVVLNWEHSNNDYLNMELNKIEKNDKYCRKYVIREDSDLERIPFLQNDYLHESVVFSYEKEFKSKFSIETENSKVKVALTNIFDTYFQSITDSDSIEKSEKKILKAIKSSLGEKTVFRLKGALNENKTINLRKF